MTERISYIKPIINAQQLNPFKSVNAQTIVPIPGKNILVIKRQYAFDSEISTPDFGKQGKYCSGRTYFMLLEEESLLFYSFNNLSVQSLSLFFSISFIYFIIFR